MIQKQLKDRRIQHYFVWMAFPDQPENASFPSCVSFKIDNFVFWKSQCSRIRLYPSLVENSSKGDKPSKTCHYRTILLATIDVPWTEKLLSPWYFMKDVLAQKFSMTECRWNFWPSKSQLLRGLKNENRPMCVTASCAKPTKKSNTEGASNISRE